MKFLIVCSYYLRGSVIEGKKAIRDFLQYYKSLPQNQEINWSFNAVKNILNNNNVNADERELLFSIVSLIENLGNSNTIVDISRLENQIEAKIQ